MLIILRLVQSVIHKHFAVWQYRINHFPSRTGKIEGRVSRYTESQTFRPFLGLPADGFYGESLSRFQNAEKQMHTTPGGIMGKCLKLRAAVVYGKSIR